MSLLIWMPNGMKALLTFPGTKWKANLELKGKLNRSCLCIHPAGLVEINYITLVFPNIKYVVCYDC